MQAQCLSHWYAPSTETQGNILNPTLKDYEYVRWNRTANQIQSIKNLKIFDLKDYKMEVVAKFVIRVEWEITKKSDILYKNPKMGMIDRLS